MRVYGILLFSSILISAIISLKSMAVALTVLTFGLALPLLFAPTVLIYLLCLLPAFVLWPTPSMRVPALAVSLLLCAGVAILPGMLSRNEAMAIAEVASQTDRPADRTAGVRTMEILRPSVFDPNNGRFPFPPEPCPAECRYLLTSGQMDWIRVTMTVSQWNGTGKNRTEMQSSTFVPGAGSACDPEGKATSSERRCVLTGANSKTEAGLLVAITQSVVKPGTGTLLTEQKAMRRISLSVLRDGRYELLLQNTESVIGTTMIPFIVGPDFGYGMSSEGLEIVRTSGRFNEISLRGALVSAGYAFTGIESVIDVPRSLRENPPPSDSLTVDVVSILDLPSTQGLSQHQLQTISMWVTQTRHYGSKRDPEPLPPVARSILMRLIADRRVTFAPFIDQVLTRHPTFLAEMLPSLLNELEKEDRPRDVLKSAARALASLEPAALAPYASRINAIRRKKFPTGYDPLSKIAGKLGMNPVPLLALSGTDEGYSWKLDGLCRAEKTWSVEIVKAMTAYLENLDPSERDLRHKLDGVESVMLRHGGWDQLVAIYTSRFPGRLEKIDARKARLARFPDRCL